MFYLEVVGVMPFVFLAGFLLSECILSPSFSLSLRLRCSKVVLAALLLLLCVAIEAGLLLWINRHVLIPLVNWGPPLQSSPVMLPLNLRLRLLLPRCLVLVLRQWPDGPPTC